MANAEERAWRFVFPQSTTPGIPAGFVLTPQGNVPMVEGAEAVRQSILLLLSTRPGERVMRPDYGCDLHQLAFAPNDDTTAGLAMHYVRRALERWEPRARILALDAGPDPDDPARLVIDLSYQVRTQPEPQHLRYSLSLTGES